MDVILTVDVEDWYQTNGLDYHHETWHRYEDRIEESTYKLLDLFDEYGAKGTFFVLGYVAARHPHLVQEIFKRGHEIGSHSNCHRLLYRMEKEEILEDIQLSKGLLENIIGEEIKYFRAPSWSVGNSQLWLIHELKKMGFTCDSSIQPFKTPLSGISHAPLIPFIPVVNGVSTELIEYPSSIGKIGPFSIPFSGGFYMRLMPYEAFKWFVVRRFRQGMKTMLYCHPWEYDENAPRVKGSVFKKILQHYNVDKNTVKLRKVLQDHRGITLGEAIREGHFEETPIR